MNKRMIDRLSFLLTLSLLSIYCCDYSIVNCIPIDSVSLFFYYYYYYIRILCVSINQSMNHFFLLPFLFVIQEESE